MTVNYSTPIVTDGLVLYSDIANSKSFIGTETINIYASNGFEFIQQEGNHSAVRTIGVAPALNLSNNYDYFTITTTGSWTSEINRVIIYNLNSGTAYNIGTNYAFSFYARTTTVNSATIGAAIYGNLINNQFTITPEWKRFTGVTSPTNQFKGFEIGSLSGAVAFQIAGLQLEAQPSATPYVNSTRGGTVATGGGWRNLINSLYDGEFRNGIVYNSSNGGSIFLDGSNDYVEFFDNLDLINSNISGSIWINPTTHKNYNAWIDKLSSNGNFRFHTWGDGVVYYGIRNTAGAYEETRTTQTIPLSTWTNICFTHNYVTRQCIIYINGISSVTNTFTIDRGDTTASLTVGYSTNNGVFANGRVANVMIYNKVLTPTEVLNNFNATRGRFGV